MSEKNKTSIDEVFGLLESRIYSFHNGFSNSSIIEEANTLYKILMPIEKDIFKLDPSEALTRTNYILGIIDDLLKIDSFDKYVLSKLFINNEDPWGISDELNLTRIKHELDTYFKELSKIRKVLEEKVSKTINQNLHKLIKTKFTQEEMVLLYSLLSEKTDYLLIPDKKSGLLKKDVYEMIISTFLSENKSNPLKIPQFTKRDFTDKTIDRLKEKLITMLGLLNSIQ